MFIFFKQKRQGVKLPGRAEPDIFRRPHLDGRLKLRGKSTPEQAIHPIGGHDQVVLLEQGKVVKLGREANVDVQCRSSGLKNSEEALTRNS